MANEETSVQRTYGRYILAYLVTLGIGLAPVVGKVRVPGFTSIAEVFPVNLQRGLAPFATFIMAIPIVCTHFFSLDRGAGSRSLDRLFRLVLPAVIVLPLLLFYLYSSWVIQVDFEGGRQSAAYVVGDEMRRDCECAKRNLDIQTCIAEWLGANPAAVTNCYPRAETNARRAGLAIVYLLMMLGFGTLIALIVLKERRQSPAAAA
jgi:hypothetical protein